MSDISGAISCLNSTVRLAGPLDVSLLLAALRAKDPEYVIAQANMLSLVNCSAFDDAVRGSAIYDCGDKKSIIFVADGDDLICNLWPVIDGIKPSESVSPSSQAGRNVTYHFDEGSFGGSYDFDTKVVRILFSKIDAA